ncbi:MAG: SurA N-terminal domain-containing protein [Arcobacteraceae bacterium]|nr:SurA N-terminal domain-containing protein [Arcobacteraceae bacterium]
MIKKIFGVLILAGYLNAGLINAIAVIVNDSVITLYDIDEVMEQSKSSHNQAVSMLIDKILYEEEVKRYNLTISEEEILSYIGKLAQANSMTMMEFKEAVIKQKQNYQVFEADIKKRLLNQKLISKIAAGKLQVATDDDIQLYYDNNIEQFKENKNSIQVLPLEQVKNKIFNLIMNQREQTYLKEYFETLKITADIKIVR